MFRSLLLFTAIGISLYSCDVRTKDKIADNTANLKASKAPHDSAAPTTVHIIDSVFDFGKVEDGEMVKFSYRFVNAGTQPLIISNVSASCGCTVPEKPEEPIKPGDTGYIKVQFNSEGRVGVTHKTVSVQSNAQPAFPELLLKGEVLAKAKQ